MDIASVELEGFERLPLYPILFLSLTPFLVSWIASNSQLEWLFFQGEGAEMDTVNEPTTEEWAQIHKGGPLVVVAINMVFFVDAITRLHMLEIGWVMKNPMSIAKVLKLGRKKYLIDETTGVFLRARGNMKRQVVLTS
ncbi:hypothetical protein L208DRAFT_1378109 [Tricholoma matsutake]|nr:hypothetical protein L208DRAFT_1378109 [Tricholoma matsutake 945]